MLAQEAGLVGFNAGLANQQTTRGAPLPPIELTPFAGAAGAVRPGLVEQASPKSVPYAVLSQRHPQYSEAMLEELEDLYVGGYRIQRKAPKYLRRMTNEEPARWDDRCVTSAYMPYFGEIVDQFAADLFAQPLSIKPPGDADDPKTPGKYPDKKFYDEFEKNCDRRGLTFAMLMKRALTQALKKRCGYVCVDAPDSPKQSAPAVNRAEEESQGVLDLYAYELPVEQLIDWEEDDQGAYTLAVVCRRESKRAGLIAQREVTIETFTVWTLGDSGKAHWQRFTVEHRPDRQVRPEDFIGMDDEGDTSFARIPILKLRLPDGLWVGNKIGPLAREHYQRRSALNGSMTRNLVVLPVAALGPEMPAPGDGISETQTDPNRPRRGRDGFLRTGAADKIYFAEPEGGAYKLVAEQLRDLKDEMFRVNHLMASSVTNTPSSLGRSGLSKQKDEDATVKVLTALGELVRLFAVAVYGLVSTARGEDVKWVAHGLDSYKADDRLAVLQEAVQIDQVSIPSQTFKQEHKFQVAQKLLSGVSPETMSQVRQEIVDGVKKEQALKDTEHEAKVAGAQFKADNPMGAPPASPGQPGVSPFPPKKDDSGKKGSAGATPPKKGDK